MLKGFGRGASIPIRARIRAMPSGVICPRISLGRTWAISHLLCHPCGGAEYSVLFRIPETDSSLFARTLVAKVRDKHYNPRRCFRRYSRPGVAERRIR